MNGANRSRKAFRHEMASRIPGESTGRCMLQQFYPFRCTSSISMKAMA